MGFSTAKNPPKFLQNLATFGHKRLTLTAHMARGAQGSDCPRCFMSSFKKNFCPSLVAPSNPTPLENRQSTVVPPIDAVDVPLRNNAELLAADSSTRPWQNIFFNGNQQLLLSSNLQLSQHSLSQNVKLCCRITQQQVHSFIFCRRSINIT